MTELSSETLDVRTATLDVPGALPPSMAGGPKVESSPAVLLVIGSPMDANGSRPSSACSRLSRST